MQETRPGETTPSFTIRCAVPPGGDGRLPDLDLEQGVTASGRHTGCAGFVNQGGLRYASFLTFGGG